tara:strand:+ start:515 stop:796 length:282 start_codon:yes stop_codon:yes gene_type:complete
MKKPFKVYILIKNKKPVYIGCTNNIKNRISSHKQEKDFDEYLILKSYKTKKEALTAENSLIRFISYFGGDEWINCKQIILQCEGDFKGFKNTL